MAAQTVHARHGSNTSSTMSSLGYPTAPGSPTLTNPDMILPDYDVPPSPDRSESPLAMWNNARADATNGNGQFETAQNSAFIAGPVTPTTPIIYGNGTMLSDIGEVTEVESTVGRSPVLSRRFDHKPVVESAVSRTSPTAGAYAVGVKKRSKAQHERRASIESNSTATTVQDQGDHFADFDDAVSVDDSNFQGDDEESVAESNLEDMSARQTKFLPLPQGTELNNDEKRYSAISISQRAEEILANAKRRLTTMEGNLTRARTSLHSASPSNSSIGSVTPSPPVGKTTSSATSPTSAPSHSRMLSEGAIGNDASAQHTKRSASALGAAGGYRQPMPASQSLNDLGSIYTRRNISHHPINLSLDSLGEEEAKAADGRSGQDSAKLDNFLSPTFGSIEDQGLTRSTSVMQMRDLKDQMQGLKGKISTLRDQAREDSLKRRSLQSLRTPSPFTHARVDQWYAGPVRPHPSGTGSTPLGRNPWNGELESIDGEGIVRDENKTPTQGTPEEDEESVISEYVAAQEDLREEDRLSTAQVASINGEDVPRKDNVEDDDKEDMRTEDGYQEDEEEEARAAAVPEQAEAYEEDVNDDASDYGSESGESIYHDTHQEAVSHEDREDAFDYEHFFLHSAMGSFSQRRLGRRGSFSSEDSVETTRGPTTSSNEKASPGGHRRRGSSDTVTTMDSFATATEGRSSRAQMETLEDNDEDEIEEHHFEGFEGEQRAPVEEKEEEEKPSRPETPLTATRGVFGSATNSANNQPRASPLAKHSASASYSYSNPSSGDERGLPLRQRSTSVIYSRPFSSAAVQAARSRPSISSFDSTGTQRSFPLINKPKLGSGVLTPQGTPPQGSPDPALRHVSESLMSEAASACEKSSSLNGGGVNGINGVSGSVSAGAADAMVMQQLAREDQILVERLVAGLGKCVLGLSESSKASSESRAYRRRIEAARRLLEGADEPC